MGAVADERVGDAHTIRRNSEELRGIPGASRNKIAPPSQIAARPADSRPNESAIKRDMSSAQSA